MSCKWMMPNRQGLQLEQGWILESITNCKRLCPCEVWGVFLFVEEEEEGGGGGGVNNIQVNLTS